MTTNVSEARPCPRCGQLRPWPDGYAVDRSKPSGRKSWCKRCDGARRNEARAPVRLELAAPAEADMCDAVETMLGALDPPPGEADAPLIFALRKVAKIFDQAASVGDVGQLCGLTAKVIALQRELVSTRAAKVAAAKVAPPPAPVKSKFEAFREAL